MKLAEEYCWAITQAEGWSCCGLSHFIVLEFEFQLDFIVYTDTIVHDIATCTQFDSRRTCVSRGVTVHSVDWRKRGILRD